MKNAVGVIRVRGGAFVGVRRKAKSKKGKMSPVNLAKLHEKGAEITQIVSPEQRRFFIAVTIKKYGEVRAPAVGSTLKIKIPARPWISHIIQKETKRQKLIPLIARDIARELHMSGIPVVVD